jgi:uncharacterized protein (DUF736 family)
MYEQKDLSGALFKNKRKTSNTHADYAGSVTVNGVEYFLDAWLKEAKSGEKYMSLRLKAKTTTNNEEPF